MTDNERGRDDDFDGAILDDRRRLVEQFEVLAKNAAGYRSKPVGDWGGTVPVVAAPLLDSLVSFGSEGATVDDGLLRDSLERSGLTADQLSVHEGVVSLATGSALEIDVHEMIRSGELNVPVGTDSVTLLGRTHPGADFEFLDGSGRIIGLMNTKASDSYSIIAEHFTSHPDVNYVYATHDAAMDAAERGYTVIDGLSGSIPLTDQPVVIDVGVSSGEYRDAFAELAATEDGGFLGLLDGDGIVDSIPWITLGVLAYRAGRRHTKGVPARENRTQLFRDTMRSGSVYGTSVALQAAGIPVPVTIVTSMFSAAAVEGVFRVKDEWGAMAGYEQSLATRAALLVGNGPESPAPMRGR